MLSEPAFLGILSLERKRTERSGRRFILMLLECSRLTRGGKQPDAIEQILGALSKSVRETDVRGWYKDRSTVGVIFTEIGPAEDKTVVNALLGKVTSVLSAALSIEQLSEIKLSFQVFPKEADDGDSGDDLTLYPDLVQRTDRKRTASVLKRCIDIGGSMALLVLCSPLLVLIAVGIKLTSKGPILFRQTRLGQNGKAFTFLKFRSMHVANDASVHQEFVAKLIAGKIEGQNGTSQTHVYKITKDKRVSPIGSILRRTSLDELPQFLNVLKGDMSLVGPRPPIPYEFNCYQTWHKHRLWEVKPGITGLWQVYGRSRVKFDDMVRLDLRYAASWSLWGDIRILLKTPGAVVTGAGAH